MKKQKFSIKNTLKTIFSVLIVIFLFVGPSFLFNPSLYKISVDKIFSTPNSSTVLELWHVETFEGGSFSRAKFLQNRAIDFNKQTQGKFIIVKNFTLEQLQLNLSKNNHPDLISFGVGCGEYVLPYLSELNINNSIRGDLIESGKIKNKQYALPYMLGGYVLITNQSNVVDQKFQNDLINNAFNMTRCFGKNTIPSLCFAKNTLINPANALVKNNVVGNKQGFLDNNFSTYDAYVKFINNASVNLLGTQRDFVRCKNREQSGKLETCYYSYLSGYSDLVQYISVFDNISQTKKDISKAFIKFLLSKQVQQQIKNINMFSVLTDTIYETQDGAICDFEKALKKPLVCVNVFSQNQVLEQNKLKSWAYLGI